MGTDLFTEVNAHYVMAKEDLDVRRVDFDKKDVLFRSHIDESAWPYNATIFDPRVFTALYEKTARTFANKPKGRVVPREGGDVLKAKIVNELLSFQWDENERVDAQPMLAKWALMDLNARKYGASFGIVKWHYECRKSEDGKTVFYDGPQFIPLPNRDCLANPSYSTVKNWFQHREYLTLNELIMTNDASRTKPVYENLDILRSSMHEESKSVGGDSRESNYNVKNKSIKGLQDYLGRDEYFKIIEVVTEYREDRWITFAPKHGVILRNIPNPYKHGQIPVVQLKYYPIDDDLYGLSEIEPIEKLQKAVNALLCQYVDAVNMSSYNILKVRATGGVVQMHTLEFGPGKLWLMQDPATDVITHDSAPQGVREFPMTYRLLIGALQEGLGEASQGISSLNPGANGTTATEIRDTAASRSARDNFSQIFLEEAMKKQMGFWHVMNQQFLFSDPKETIKIINIVGKEAIKYFKKVGLDINTLSEDSQNLLTDEAFDGIDTNFEDFKTPLYPVETEDGVVPKMEMADDGTMAKIYLEASDLDGMYDYIPDIDSMRLPDKAQEISALKEAIALSLNPTTQALLAQEQTKLKIQDLLEDYYERLGVHDASKYFEKLEVQPMQNDQQPIEQAGAGGLEGQFGGMGNVQPQGMEGADASLLGGQAQSIIS